jgi:hypothetical protein
MLNKKESVKMSKAVTYYIMPDPVANCFPTTSLPMSKKDSKTIQTVIASNCAYTISIHLAHFGRKYFPQHSAQHFGVSTITHTTLAQSKVLNITTLKSNTPVLQ